MKIYTKGGDSGETGVPGRRMAKSEDIFEALGDLDELNSVLGWAFLALPAVPDVVAHVQSVLLDLGATLANSQTPLPARAFETTVRLEQEIDAMTDGLPPLTNFILPGGSEAGARLHVARTVCRRAERSLVKSGYSGEGLALLNRLSDYLFTLARFANHPDTPEPTYHRP